MQIAVFLTMKKYAVFTLALAFAAIPTTAFAQITGYKGLDGYFHLRGLEPNKSYPINLGGMPLVRVGVSNSCGILRISSTKAFKESDRFEVRDEKKGEIYGFENKSLPIIEAPRCTGQLTTKRELWKDNKGAVFISGLSPSGAMTIKMLTNNPTRNLRANLCGMISLKLDTNPAKAFILDGQAYPNTGQARRGIYCRRNTLYVSIPASTPVIPVSEIEWKNQNPVAFSGGITIIQKSGTDWIEIKTAGNGGGYAGGGTGNGGGTTVQSPQPPAGSTFCKVGSSQLLVMGLTSGINYYVATPEDDIYSNSVADSSGKALFNNIDYADVWEGQSADIELGKNPNRQFIQILAALSNIQPCQ